MKFRKEYVVFGIVVVLLIVVVTVALTNKKSYGKFDVEQPKYQVTSGDSSTNEPYYEPSAPVIDSDGWIGSPIENSSSAVDDEEPDVTDVPVVTQPSEPVDTTPPDDEVGSEVTDELPEDGQGDGFGLPVTDEQIGYMVAYYVCGMEHQLFEANMSSELVTGFGSLDGEPYSELQGNTSFVDLDYTDGIVSFGTAGGTLYRFKITINDGVVSGIEYIS